METKVVTLLDTKACKEIQEERDVEPWFGGSTVRIRVPTTKEILVGQVHWSTGRGRVRVLVDSDEKKTTILAPRENTVAVIDL